MRLKEFINLFEGKFQLTCAHRVTRSNDTSYVATFETSTGHSMEFVAQGSAVRSPNETWDVTFRSIKRPEPQFRGKPETAIEVFSTIMCIMKEFVDSKKPASFIFTSEGKRSRIYNTLVRRFETDITRRGYSYTSHSQSGKIVHTFVRR